ncbi:MAG: hypothetical protein Q4B54_04000 [Coriobacteriales bacterium]|nr:hypothetical protein [Coriobacteriales bacterium]
MNSPNSSGPQLRSSIFNQEAQDKLRGVDDMQKGMHMVKIRRWSIAMAIVALALGLAVWGFFGMYSSSLSVKSITRMNENNEVEISCLVLPEEAELIRVGDDAVLTGKKSKVTHIGDLPLSANEVREAFETNGMGDLADKFVRGEWMYMVSFDTEQISLNGLAMGTAIDTVILCERVTPIQQFLRGFSWQER